MLYVLKARGMKHSNQVREFLISDRGIELVDAYIGASGVLTGSARAAQEALEKAAVLRVTSLWARSKSQAFHKITTQLPTDMTSSARATPLLTASPWRSRSNAFTASPTHQTCQTTLLFYQQETAWLANYLGRR